MYLNPISHVFLVKRHENARKNIVLNNYILDIGSSINPITKMAIKLDLKRKSGIDIQASVLNLPFRPNIFDFIFMLEVIEHIPYPIQSIALNEINRVMKVQSRFIISTPSMFPTWRIIWFFWERLIISEYLHDHVGQLHIQELLQLLNKSKFKVLELRKIMLFDLIVICKKC